MFSFFLSAIFTPLKVMPLVCTTSCLIVKTAGDEYFTANGYSKRMANYKGHVAGGVGAGAVYALLLGFVPVARFAETAGLLHNWQAITAIVVISVLFGLFPDVDTNSKAQDMFFGIAFPLDIILIWVNRIEAAAYLGLISMLPIVGHHRGWTHKRWAMIVVPLPILIIPYLYNQAVLPISLIYYGAAITGYFSHLLLDGLIWRRFRIKN
jgi:membrane-bound metal-dependent hydrolase YbcI (DUF457 family)